MISFNPIKPGLFWPLVSLGGGGGLFVPAVYISWSTLKAWFPPTAMISCRFKRRILGDQYQKVLIFVAQPFCSSSPILWGWATNSMHSHQTRRRRRSWATAIIAAVGTKLYGFCTKPGQCLHWSIIFTINQKKFNVTSFLPPADVIIRSREGNLVKIRKLILVCKLHRNATCYK